MPPAGQPPNEVWRDFVLARHAKDLTAVFGSLTGSTPAGPTPELRVGVLDHDPELGFAVDPACAAGVHVAARLLEGLGHSVEVAWPTALDHLWSAAAGPVMVLSDAARPDVLAWVSRRLGRPVDRGELDDGVFEAATRATARTEDEVGAAQAGLDAAVTPITAWWDEYDLLVTPTTFRPAWPLGGSSGPEELGTLVAPFSFTGQPALSLPLHETDGSLPVGVQLVDGRGKDTLLLRLAEDLQEADDWTRRRPPLAL